MDNTPAFDMVLFGSTGDLVMRKLLPSLYQAHAAGLLNENGRILCLGRKQISLDEYLELVETNSRQHVKAKSEESWKEFLTRVDYLKVDAGTGSDYPALAEWVGPDTQKSVVCYLSLAPELFTVCCEHLAAVGLNRDNVRVVLEKPLGTDLESSNAINEAVAKHFKEEQLYRIDHYLGKESVQNLMAIRFGNALFEPLWRREWVHDVQITIAEDLGVEGRGDFYDGTGALRDMIQNHLLQLLCIVAMEPPANMSADAVRDEKLKVLKALRPFTSNEDVASNTVRGQYKSGAVNGKPVKAYREEKNVPADSQTETFVAIKAEIENWRWAGVPFYLRTGKHLQERLAEIVINFRDVPYQLFPSPVGSNTANRLVISLQPDESIRMHFLAKEPGDTMRLQPAFLNLDFNQAFSVRRADAYERLLLDVIRGQLALFMRRDELIEAWRWVTPIMEAWKHSTVPPKLYTSGTWGPAASSALLSRDGVSWHEES
ncbi:glucose-6-phosphate dehydrogenase [Paludibacterium yongneupense]|uniref:glucose-6-phosphate dehydrogenase n=1 Tax=Paludibacterium yongneupense TaxID=400061 RepID=UPI00049189D3